MKLTKCDKGHFYDADKYPECPYCNTALQKDGGSGTVTAADALLVMRCALGTAELSPETAALCDADGDGNVTLSDAVLILRAALGLG